MRTRGAVCFKDSAGNYSRSLYSKWTGAVVPFLMQDFLAKAGKLAQQKPEEAMQAFYRWIVQRTSTIYTAQHYNLQEFSKTADYELGNWVVSYDPATGKLLGYQNLENNLAFDGRTERRRKEDQEASEASRTEEARIQRLIRGY